MYLLEEILFDKKWNNNEWYIESFYISNAGFLEIILKWNKKIHILILIQNIFHYYLQFLSILILNFRFPGDKNFSVSS